VERLEKRLKRIQRWVDRCIEACRCKAWTSAIAELECARAELETASREIWEAAAEGEPMPCKNRTPFPRTAFLHALPVTVIVLLLAVGPTSIESFNPARPTVAENAPSVEWVTPDEKALLENFRKSLSAGSAAGVPGPKSIEAAGYAYPAGKKARRGSPAEALDRDAASGGASSKGAVPIAAEDLLSLIQVGQRALRTEAESVRIESP
jgi:hypothetical protein